jgi:hypothetical protein
LPTGVVTDKLGKYKDQYLINGRLVTREEAHQAVGEPQIPDDAGLLRFTVIGADADRTRVLSDLNQHPALAGVKPKLLVQDYEPNHYEVERSHFVNSGKPTIYLQAPDGKVLLRTDSYDGPEALAEQIRKADPNYDPAKDPDGKPKSKTVIPENIPWPLIALGVLGLVLLLKR